MSGWAWFLIAMLLMQALGAPAMVGRPRPPLTGAAAAILVGIYLVEMFALLKLAGVL